RVADLAESSAGRRRNFAGCDLRLCTGCGSDCGASVGLRGQGVGALTEPVLGRPDCLGHGPLGARLDGGDAHRGYDGGGAHGTMGADCFTEADPVVAARPNPALRMPDGESPPHQLWYRGTL